MTSSRLARLGAVALAALLLPAPAPAQKFPGNLPDHGYLPPQEGGQPHPYAGGKFDRAPAPRPVAPAPAQPVRADVTADALQLQAEDPPAIVGRIARATGTASLRLAGGEDWRPAAPNTAIVAGNALWTEPGARLGLEAGPAQLFLDGATALQLDGLDEQGLRATLAQGSVFLRVSGLEAVAGTVDIATPEASIATAIDSRILVEAAAPDGSRPGRVAVYEGGAEVTLASSAEPIRLGPAQAIALLPGGGVPAIETAGPPTPLMAWALGAEPRAPLPAAVRGMTGAGELGLSGRWDRSPDYGEVWYPPVDPGWVPYSDGSWEWRDPWGWTWVDAAPWGFVTAHYGRWVRIGPRWGWAPAPVPIIGLPPLRPVWAPALVSFFAPPPRPGWGRPVGWIPLGPREPWYPWYRASPAYVARVNIRQVPHVAPLRQSWQAWGGPERRWDADRWNGPEDRRFDAYRNRAAATLVPERTLLASQPVRPEARRADAVVLRQAAAPSALPLRPAPETRGLTERGATRFGLPQEAWRAARPERVAEPPAALRSALPGGPGPRPADAPPRQAMPAPGNDPRAQPQLQGGMPAQRQQELRERLLQPQPGAAGGGTQALRPPDAPRGAADKFGPTPQQAPGVQADQARRQQEMMQRQQMDQARRQQEQTQQQMQRQQMDQSRRQQEQTQQQMQRQQMDQSRRQQEQTQQQMQRQQMDQSRRQQEQAQQQMQRQQMEQARRQQEQAQQQMQRQQMEQARRQQEQMQRQQQATQAQRQQQQQQQQRQQHQRPQ